MMNKLVKGIGTFVTGAAITAGANAQDASKGPKSPQDKKAKAPLVEPNPSEKFIALAAKEAKKTSPAKIRRNKAMMLLNNLVRDDQITKSKVKEAAEKFSPAEILVLASLLLDTKYHMTTKDLLADTASSKKLIAAATRLENPPSQNQVLISGSKGFKALVEKGLSVEFLNFAREVVPSKEQIIENTKQDLITVLTDSGRIKAGAAKKMQAWSYTDVAIADQVLRSAELNKKGKAELEIVQELTGRAKRTLETAKLDELLDDISRIRSVIGSSGALVEPHSLMSKTSPQNLQEILRSPAHEARLAELNDANKLNELAQKIHAIQNPNYAKLSPAEKELAAKVAALIKEERTAMKREGLSQKEADRQIANLEKLSPEIIDDYLSSEKVPEPDSDRANFEEAVEEFMRTGKGIDNVQDYWTILEYDLGPNSIDLGTVKPDIYIKPKKPDTDRIILR